MGLAAVATYQAEEQDSRLSALEVIQGQLIRNRPTTAADIRRAVEEDIRACTLFSLTILTKSLTSRKVVIGPSDIDSLIVLIREAMTRLPLEDPTLFINYAQAAVICVRAKEARRAHT